ncbi:uncharacterized protein LOC141653042 [Silene latifolia]|uniref:uncharacterized protein LOC141653042 n=1 Tax=Silene latifolia TaxID=37657 RepID=UPI003D783786
MTTKTSRTIPDPNLEKQMGGCMAGFFNLFDRHHLLSAKRLHPKRLPPPPPSPPPPTVNDSPLKPQQQQQQQQPPPPQQQQQQQPEIRLKETAPTPAPAPTAELPTKSPWKFAREAPRLSLDSRAITDGNGGLRPREIRIKTGNMIDDDEGETQRRSPSVIARLMGLEPIPSSSSTGSETEPVKKVELRRSASESRSRDYRFVEPASFLTPVAGERKVIKKQPINKNVIKTNINTNTNNNTNPKARNSNQFSNNHSNYNNNYNNQRRLMLERRSYYDTADFYPPEIMMKKQQQQQLQHQPITIYGEIERKLRLKGIDEPSKDLETLKNILEALQLKGLLHSSTTANTATKNRHNVVYDRTPANRRRNCQVSVSSGEPSVSPRRERPVRTGRGENRSSSPVLRRKGSSLSVETTATVAAKRSSNSPVRSPRVARRTDQTVSKSPRGRRSSAETNQGVRVRSSGQIFTEDEVSTVSESSFSTSSHTDNERWRVEEYRDGRNLLERCDKLLNSIAEITASNCSNSNSNSNSNSSELQQPSPVSVLDSSFYKEDDSSPSPVKKRTIHFKDQAATELEDDQWSPASSTRLLITDNDIYSSDDFEFNYISEVIRASNYFPDDNNLFFMLEKQISIRGDNSKASILHRKLLFDTITEILDRNQHIPPWKAVFGPEKRSVSEQIFSEFQKIRETNPSEDLFEVICGVLKKDMAEDLTTGWAGCPVEMSEAVLDIERLVFKDLIGEIIRDLAVLAGKSVGVQAPRRKLVF